MTGGLPQHVTLVGAGTLGRGWIRVFARHGVQVTVYDQNPSQIEQTLAWLSQDLVADVAAGFVSAEARERMLQCTRGEPDLARALAQAEYVQESAPEQMALKQALFAELWGSADVLTKDKLVAFTKAWNEVNAGPDPQKVIDKQAEEQRKQIEAQEQ